MLLLPFGETIFAFSFALFMCIFVFILSQSNAPLVLITNLEVDFVAKRGVISLELSSILIFVLCWMMYYFRLLILSLCLLFLF